MDQLELVKRTRLDLPEKIEALTHELIERKDNTPTTTKTFRQFSGIPTFATFGKNSVLAAGESFVPDFSVEAIILGDMRPAWLVQNDEIVMTGDYELRNVVLKNKIKLEKETRKVGRIDLFDHQSLNFAGTGWLITKNIVCTNRHVAEVFAEQTMLGEWRQSSNRFGEKQRSELSFLRQHNTSENPNRRAIISEVLFVAERNELDLALLKVTLIDEVDPLELNISQVKDETPCAVIGYPAWDGHRNEKSLMDKIFGGIYNVKRFAPGIAFQRGSGDGVIVADYSSLGGNSGSAVIELDAGKVLGLHFAGSFRQANYALSSDLVWAAVNDFRTQVSVKMIIEEETIVSEFEDYGGRTGYDAEFLGTGDLAVSLPLLEEHSDFIAPVESDSDNILRYQHFSLVQHAKRRLPLFAAVNVDVSRAKQLKRKASWRLDPRITRDAQTGNELYKGSSIDRGHMVRRKYVGWGELEAAQRGELDTFHYTNCVPRHDCLNQRHWMGLEDYILESVKSRGFKASIFTGPIFRKDDPKLRGREDVAIPREFWKIIVMIDDKTGLLIATGFVLSYGRMVRSIAEGFVYGRYKTYQVPIVCIAEETGLGFDHLAKSDNFASALETKPLIMAKIIDCPEDIVL